MRITVTGNLTHDPSLKFTNSGKAVCEVTIASNYKANKDAEDEVSYIDVTLWQSLAENFANSMHKGQRVFAEGRVQQQNWENDKGEKRSKLKVVADSAGPDLRFHTATVVKAEKRSATTTPAAENDFPF